MTMKAKRASSAKTRRLKSRGWKSGTVTEFLGLTPEEAERLDSSQSRVAKLETGAPGVSLDLLVRAALATGSTRAEVAAALGHTAR